MNTIKNEPVMTAAGLTALVTAVLYLLTTFGVALTGEQQAAIIGVAGIVMQLGMNWWARAQVTPVHKLMDDEDEDAQFKPGQPGA